MPDLDLSDDDLDITLTVLAPAQVAMSHGMTRAEASTLLAAILPIIYRTMPPELLATDLRVQGAKDLLRRCQMGDA